MKELWKHKTDIKEREKPFRGCFFLWFSYTFESAVICLINHCCAYISFHSECFSFFSHFFGVFKLLFHVVIDIHGIQHTAHDTFLIHCLSPFFLSIKLSLTLSTGMAFITFSHNSFFII